MSTLGLDTILATQSTAQTSSVTDKVATDKNTFLKLLVKQLQYQDPLNPMENTEFASQLAQFSSLEALTSMKDSIDWMSKIQNSMNSMESLSFIGKQVSASGNTINYSSGESSINLNVAGDASKVEVTIYNSSGTPVRTIDMKNVQQGDITCTWDGMDDNGKAQGAGTYYFNIKATGYDGSAVNTTAYANGTVTGVRFDNGVIYLEIGDKEVSLSDVKKITG